MVSPRCGQATGRSADNLSAAKPSTDSPTNGSPRIAALHIVNVAKPARDDLSIMGAIAQRKKDLRDFPSLGDER